MSNYRNGIDVDKFDYFERDSAQLGFKNNFNHRRYIDCTRVIRSSEPPYLTQICVRDKEITNLYEMFHIREYLTRRAYKVSLLYSYHLYISLNYRFRNSYRIYLICPF